MKKDQRSLRDKAQQIYDPLVILIIIGVVLAFVIEMRAVAFYAEHRIFFDIFDWSSAFFFVGDYLARIYLSKAKTKYIFSFYGLVDFASSIPNIIFLMFGGALATDWSRLFKIARLARVLKLSRKASFLAGVSKQALPFVLIALAFKGILFGFEGEGWWPDTGGMSTIISVSGFTLAIVLGAKLSILNGRMHAIEDALSRIVGGMRDMSKNQKIQPTLFQWSNKLEQALRTGKENRAQAANGMRLATEDLEALLEEHGIGGPNTAGFHRDVAFLLHRINSQVSTYYNDFLVHVCVVYVGFVIFVIDGWLGFLASGLIAYIVAGLFILVADMEDCLSHDEDSLIDADISALLFFNKYSSEK